MGSTYLKLINLQKLLGLPKKIACMGCIQFIPSTWDAFYGFDLEKDINRPIELANECGTCGATTWFEVVISMEAAFTGGIRLEKED